MKKVITIGIIVLLALGFGYFLFKISPQEKAQQVSSYDSLFSLKPTKQLDKPADVQTDDHILGNPNAKNTMVAYEDLQCPACANFEPTLKAIPEQLPDTKLIFRHFPLIGLHKNASVAALAAEAANEQGKFWEFSFYLYEHQIEWSDLADPVDKFGEYAKTVGVANTDLFKTEITSSKFKDRVQRDLTEGFNLNVGGTPTIFFNGKELTIGGIDQIKQEAQGLFIK